MADGDIRFSVMNIITIALIAFVSVWLINWVLEAAGLGKWAATPHATPAAKG